MLTPMLIQQMIKRNTGKKFSYISIYADTTIGNITNLKRMKFAIVYDEKKIDKIHKNLYKFIVDVNTCIITVDGKVPDYIYPIAIPEEILDTSYFDVERDIEAISDIDKNAYRRWKSTFNELRKSKIENLLN